MLALSAAGFMATSTLGESPGRRDVVVGDVDLEGRHAGQGAGRGPDLGREVGEGGQVVAEQGRRGGEPVAGQLHAVAGVAGEPDDDAVEQVGGFRVGGGVGHRAPLRTALALRRVSRRTVLGAVVSAASVLARIDTQAPDRRQRSVYRGPPPQRCRSSSDRPRPGRRRPGRPARPRSGDGDRRVQVDVLDGVDQGRALVGRPLEGLAAHDEARSRRPAC